MALAVPRTAFTLRRLVVLALALCAGCGTVAPSRPVPLCILHTCDIHGHIVPEKVPKWRDRAGGAAVLAGCVRAVREENARRGIPTLLVDAGDFYLGSPEGDTSKGLALVEVMNAVGYDAVAVGNHDWDDGPANLADLAARARFPFLAANVVGTETRKTPSFLKTCIVRNCGPLRVGIAGITLEDSNPQELPGGQGSIVCAEPEEYARGAVDELRREGVGLVVLLSHLGMAGDKRIARDVGGIGVIVGGHDHLAVREPFRSFAHGTLICHAGSYGKYLGKLDIAVDPASGEVKDYAYELLPLVEGKCAPDAAVQAVVDKWRGVTGGRFDEVVGRSESDFYKGREGVAMLGEMIADGMREATGAQIAFNQRHGIRGPLLKGEIRYRDVYAVLPFDDTLWTVRLTGAQVREILEKVLSFRRPDNLRFSGLAVEYDPGAPRGHRIVNASCGGSPLDDEATYLVAVNTYLVKWGFINDLVAKGRELRDTGIAARDTLAAYIRAHSPVSEEAFRSPRLVAAGRPEEGASATPTAIEQGPARSQEGAISRPMVTGRP